MPLGAAKIAYQGYTPPAGGGSTFTSAVYDDSLTTDAIDNLNFQLSSWIDFAGFNSSGEPVFISVYNDSGRDNLYAVMWSVDGSDGTITTGTKYTAITNTNNVIYPAVVTERGHANIRQDITPSDHCVIAYRNISNNKVNAIAASYDLDALTMSFGSSTTFSDVLEADGMVELVFAGTSGEYICITRSGSNNTPKFSRIDRSSTTLSVGISEQSIEVLGGYEYASAVGFKDDRAMIVASANNRDLVGAHIMKFDSTDTLRGFEQFIQEGNETNTRSVTALFNATDSFINIRWETQVSPTNTQVEGGVITWNGTGSTLPTLTQTNQIEVNASNTSYSIGASNGAIDNEAYVWQKDGTGTAYNLWKFSISGTTITEEYEKSFNNPSITFSGNPELHSNTVKDANDNVFLVTQDRNNANGYPAVRVIVNPDGLA